MTDKELYQDFCTKVYVPIYSKPWWMDAICGEENWDVWLYEKGGEIVAAMPYYLEQRKAGLYITKPLLTQNNGIIFKYPDGAGKIAQAKFEEKVIDAANEFVDNLGLAVYEQQFHYSFTNWLPFSWQGCVALPRYTYVIEDTSDIDQVWANFSSSYRKNIKKGLRNGDIGLDIDPETFYQEYDFEGSMIKRISKSFREFGGEPKLYFRIRKIYSPEVIKMEAEQQIEKLAR